jgi:hypothetical protein
MDILGATLTKEVQIVYRLFLMNRHLLHHTAGLNTIFSHIYFTCTVYLIEVLEVMAQMLQYIIFLSLKAIKVSSDFILN